MTGEKILIILCVFYFADNMASYDDENQSKFMRKAKENPFVPAGE